MRRWEARKQGRANLPATAVGRGTALGGLCSPLRPSPVSVNPGNGGLGKVLWPPRPSRFGSGGTKSTGGDSGPSSIKSGLLGDPFPGHLSQQFPQPRCPGVDRFPDTKWKGQPSVAPGTGLRAYTVQAHWRPREAVRRPLAWPCFPAHCLSPRGARAPDNWSLGGPHQDRRVRQPPTPAVLAGAGCDLGDEARSPRTDTRITSAFG